MSRPNDQGSALNRDTSCFREDDHGSDSGLFVAYNHVPLVDYQSSEGHDP